MKSRRDDLLHTRLPEDRDFEWRDVDEFARDLLGLIRNVGVYPAGHPFLRDLVARLCDIARDRLPAPLCIGVSRDELILQGRFFGGTDSRCEALAHLLHSRNLARLVWTPDVRPPDVFMLAETLRTGGGNGCDVAEALRTKGVGAIEIEPLTLDRFHRAFRIGSTASEAEGRERTRDAWLWLLEDSVTPERTVEALADAAQWDHTEIGEDQAAAMMSVLGRAERRLEKALQLLPTDRRRQVVARLEDVGRRTPIGDLARLLTGTDQGSVLHGTAVRSLEAGIDDDRLVDLLAAMISEGGKGSQRLLDVYRRFAPSAGVDALLPVVRGRLQSDQGGAFALDVWKTLEDFLFNLHEDPFMEEEYAQALEGLARSRRPNDRAGSEPTELGEYEQDLMPHLDRIVLALSCKGCAEADRRLVPHLSARQNRMPLSELLAWVHRVDDCLPDTLDRHPAILEEMTDRLCREARNLHAEERESACRFARRHEQILLGSLLRRLSEEERISARRLLVDLLAALSPATTPALISRMRRGPWYVTRNLAVALGNRQDPAAVPALRGLLQDEHPKVRKEALRALGRIATQEARDTLTAAAGEASRLPEERQLAAHLCESTSESIRRGDRL